MTPPQTPADLERMVADVRTPHGPLNRFVAVRARVQDATVSVSSRCWPQERYPEVRAGIRRLAASYAGATVSFPTDPFPAMVCPERDAHALAHHLRRALGRDAVTELHAAFPFNGEDFALYLDRVPGTYTFLGVRAPDSPHHDLLPALPRLRPGRARHRHRRTGDGRLDRAAHRLGVPLIGPRHHRRHRPRTPPPVRGARTPRARQLGP
ncbi:hypothetical protein GCM10010341_48100 [Streptomyces noursei]|nr:hypothetical protein GCM10010341_48100 [Streptomyces noursei]